MKPPAKKPCNECPFRRKSVPGYVGAAIEALESLGVPDLNRPRQFSFGKHPE